MPSPTPTVSVIVPTLRRPAEVVRLTESLAASDWDELEIVVVDQDSDAALRETLLALDPRVRVLWPGPGGLSQGGRRHGADNSRGELIFFVDDDNVVDISCVREVASAMISDPGIGVAAPMMAYLSRPTTTWCAGAAISRLGLVSHPGQHGDLEQMRVGELPDPDFFPNAYMTRRELLEQHPFDLRFTHYWAEPDYTLRVRAAGYTLTIVRSATVWHDIHHDQRLSRIGSVTLFDAARSRILFRAKFNDTLTSRLIFWLGVLPASTLAYGYQILRAKNELRRQLWKAYFSGHAQGLREAKQLRRERVGV